MSDSPHLKCSCRHCGTHIEFPADGIGTVVDCPNCGNQTTLSADAASKKKTVVLTVSGVIVLFLALALVVKLLYLPTRHGPRKVTIVTNTAARPQPSAEPVPAEILTNEFRIVKITIENAESGGIRYAAGTVKNESDQQRFGVKIMLDELDQSDHKVGSASDYAAVIEPRKEWRFRALLTHPRTTAVRLAGIGEQK